MFTFMDVEWRRAGLEMDMCKELVFFHLLRLMILSWSFLRSIIQRTLVTPVVAGTGGATWGMLRGMDMPPSRASRWLGWQELLKK